MTTLEPRLHGRRTAQLRAAGINIWVDSAGDTWEWNAFRTRYVRTAAGARRYKLPIGAPIPTGKRVGHISMPDGSTRVRLTPAQRAVAGRVFGPDSGANGANHAGGVHLDVDNPAAAGKSLDQHLDGGDLTPGQRRTAKVLRDKVAGLDKPADNGDGGGDGGDEGDAPATPTPAPEPAPAPAPTPAPAPAPEATPEPAAPPAADTAPDVPAPTPSTPTGPALPQVSEARVTANADHVQKAVDGALAEVMGKGANPDRLSKKDKDNLFFKLRGPAGEKVKKAIQDVLAEDYPTATPADHDLAVRSAMRELNTRLTDSTRTPRGRGTQLAVRALDRKTAFRAGGGDHRAAVAEARALIGDPAEFGKAPDGNGIDVDPDDGGPSAELLAKVEALRSAGAAISAAVDDRLANLPDGGTPTEKAQARRDVLAEVRQMGAQGDNTLGLTYQGITPDSQQRLQPMFDRSESSYPTDWIANNRAKGSIEVVGEDAGAWYNPGSHTLNVGNIDDPAMQEDAIVHELGHSMEASNPGIKRAEAAYLRDRISRGAVGSRKFDKPDSANAVTQEEKYSDSFLFSYSGVAYGVSGAHELLTTGVESLMGPGGRTYTDADLEQFVLGLLAAL